MNSVYSFILNISLNQETFKILLHAHRHGQLYKKLTKASEHALSVQMLFEHYFCEAYERSQRGPGEFHRKLPNTNCIRKRPKTSAATTT